MSEEEQRGYHFFSPEDVEWRRTSISRFAEFEKYGDYLEGIVHEVNLTEGATTGGGEVCGYCDIFCNETGDLVRLTLAQTVLANGFKSTNPSEGDIIRVVYDGEKDTGKGNPAKLFSVHTGRRKEISDEEAQERFGAMLSNQENRLGEPLVRLILLQHFQLDYSDKDAVMQYKDRKSMKDIYDMLKDLSPPSDEELDTIHADLKAAETGV